MISRQNDTGDTWSSINLMDYSMSLNYQFTAQQRERIRQVLYYSPLIPGPKKSVLTLAPQRLLPMSLSTYQ